jgi:hypothetical protein
LPVSHPGAQRASRQLRPFGLIGFAVIFALGGLAAQPGAVRAAALKVVIVVGPVSGSSRTLDYIESANRLATRAAKYGATVVKIYSPNATWGVVSKKAVGANLLIYLGHGNGWPSPYTYDPNFTTKDGMGLNAAATGSHSNHKYYGEPYMAQLGLARNAVVILHRLCYASGNSEWGRAAPTVSIAKQRVDNYGAGFMKGNARAVFAEGITNVAPIIDQLFTTSRYMKDVFNVSSSAHPEYANIWYASVRTKGKKIVMDPDRSEPGRYYRSLVGDTLMRASAWRAAGN